MKKRTRGKVIILSGPSGSGKTTLQDFILKNPRLRSRLCVTVSMTTRAPRPGEKEGRDYFFISKKMFDYKRRVGHFLESMKVFDNYYGTPAKQVRDIRNKGKSVLLCIDVQGAAAVRRLIKDAVTIFIKPPSFAVLKQRLTRRATESKKILDVRLHIAKQEMRKAKEYDYIIVNDDLRHAQKELEALIIAILSGR